MTDDAGISQQRIAGLGFICGFAADRPFSAITREIIWKQRHETVQHLLVIWAKHQDQFLPHWAFVSVEAVQFIKCVYEHVYVYCVAGGELQ